MTTFQTIHLICPLCKQAMGHYDLASFHVFGSTVYSDGKVEQQGNFFEDKAFIVCPHCMEAFWREDAKEQPIDFDKDREEMLFSKSAWDLGFAKKEDFPVGFILYYNELLEKGFANTPEREIHLRMMLWHSINDIIRYQIPLFKAIDAYALKKPGFFIKSRWYMKRTFRRFSKLHYDNLLRLSQLYDPPTEDDLLLKVEMFREMGLRSQALKLLKSLRITPEKHYRKIKRATRFFKKRVF